MKTTKQKTGVIEEKPDAQNTSNPASNLPITDSQNTSTNFKNKTTRQEKKETDNESVNSTATLPTRSRQDGGTLRQCPKARVLSDFVQSDRGRKPKSQVSRDQKSKTSNSRRGTRSLGVGSQGSASRSATLSRHPKERTSSTSTFQPPKITPTENKEPEHNNPAVPVPARGISSTITPTEYLDAQKANFFIPELKKKDPAADTDGVTAEEVQEQLVYLYIHSWMTSYTLQYRTSEETPDLILELLALHAQMMVNILACSPKWKPPPKSNSQATVKLQRLLIEAAIPPHSQRLYTRWCSFFGYEPLWDQPCQKTMQGDTLQDCLQLWLEETLSYRSQVALMHSEHEVSDLTPFERFHTYVMRFYSYLQDKRLNTLYQYVRQVELPDTLNDLWRREHSSWPGTLDQLKEVLHRTPLFKITGRSPITREPKSPTPSSGSSKHSLSSVRSLLRKSRPPRKEVGRVKTERRTVSDVDLESCSSDWTNKSPMDWSNYNSSDLTKRDRSHFGSSNSSKREDETPSSDGGSSLTEADLRGLPHDATPEEYSDADTASESLPLTLLAFLDLEKGAVLVSKVVDALQPDKVLPPHCRVDSEVELLDFKDSLLGELYTNQDTIIPMQSVELPSSMVTEDMDPRVATYIVVHRGARPRRRVDLRVDRPIPYFEGGYKLASPFDIQEQKYKQMLKYVYDHTMNTLELLEQEVMKPVSSFSPVPKVATMMPTPVASESHTTYATSGIKTSKTHQGKSPARSSPLQFSNFSDNPQRSEINFDIMLQSLDFKEHTGLKPTQLPAVVEEVRKKYQTFKPPTLRDISDTLQRPVTDTYIRFWIANILLSQNCHLLRAYGKAHVATIIRSVLAPEVTSGAGLDSLETFTVESMALAIEESFPASKYFHSEEFSYVSLTRAIGSLGQYLSQGGIDVDLIYALVEEVKNKLQEILNNLDLILKVTGSFPKLTVDEIPRKIVRALRCRNDRDWNEVLETRFSRCREEGGERFSLDDLKELQKVITGLCRDHTAVARERARFMAESGKKLKTKSNSLLVNAVPMGQGYPNATADIGLITGGSPAMVNAVLGQSPHHGTPRPDSSWVRETWSSQLTDVFSGRRPVPTRLQPVKDTLDRQKASYLQLCVKFCLRGVCPVPTRCRHRHICLYGKVHHIPPDFPNDEPYICPCLKDIEKVAAERYLHWFRGLKRGEYNWVSVPCPPRIYEEELPEHWPFDDKIHYKPNLRKKLDQKKYERGRIVESKGDGQHPPPNPPPPPRVLPRNPPPEKEINEVVEVEIALSPKVDNPTKELEKERTCYKSVCSQVSSTRELFAPNLSSIGEEFVDVVAEPSCEVKYNGVVYEAKWDEEKGAYALPCLDEGKSNLREVGEPSLTMHVKSSSTVAEDWEISESKLKLFQVRSGRSKIEKFVNTAPLLFIPVRVNGTLFVACLDTAAQTSFITTRGIHKMDRFKTPYDPFEVLQGRLTSFTNEEKKIRKGRRLTMSLKGNSKNLTYYDADTGVDFCDFLVGMDLLRELGAVIDCQNMQVEFRALGPEPFTMQNHDPRTLSEEQEEVTRANLVSTALRYSGEKRLLEPGEAVRVPARTRKLTHSRCAPLKGVKGLKGLIHQVHDDPAKVLETPNDRPPVRVLETIGGVDESLMGKRFETTVVIENPKDVPLTLSPGDHIAALQLGVISERKVIAERVDTCPTAPAVGASNKLTAFASLPLKWLPKTLETILLFMPLLSYWYLLFPCLWLLHRLIVKMFPGCAILSSFRVQQNLLMGVIIQLLLRYSLPTVLFSLKFNKELLWAAGWIMFPIILTLYSRVAFTLSRSLRYRWLRWKYSLSPRTLIIAALQVGAAGGLMLVQHIMERVQGVSPSTLPIVYPPAWSIYIMTVAIVTSNLKWKWWDGSSFLMVAALRVGWWKMRRMVTRFFCPLSRYSWPSWTPPIITYVNFVHAATEPSSLVEDQEGPKKEQAPRKEGNEEEGETLSPQWVVTATLFDSLEYWSEKQQKILDKIDWYSELANNREEITPALFREAGDLILSFDIVGQDVDFESGLSQPSAMPL